MFEVLVFMFENYFANQAIPDDNVLEQELAEAGFEKSDILGAFDLAAISASLNDFTNAYQISADTPTPLFRRRI